MHMRITQPDTNRENSVTEKHNNYSVNSRTEEAMCTCHVYYREGILTNIV